MPLVPATTRAIARIEKFPNFMVVVVGLVVGFIGFAFVVVDVNAQDCETLTVFARSEYPRLTHPITY
jgi:hypothetical protein